MKMKRRHFLLTSLRSTALLGAGMAGLLQPLAALAKRNDKAFTADAAEEALAALFPGRDIILSDKIDIGVHELVENGAVVPVNVETSLADVKSITVLADKNPNPLIARFNLAPPCQGFIATRLKVAEPSSIIAVVETGNKIYKASKFVEVVAGGCG